jgi:molybdate transport system substrate-binding protein
MRSAAAFRTLLLAALASIPCAAQAPVRMIASNGVRAVLEAVRPQAEKAIGRPVSFEFDTSSALVKSIASGAACDVAVMTSESLDDLVKQGKVSSASVAVIGRAGIGVGIKAGAPKPDLHNTAAFKQTLLKAKGITYAQDGASRPRLEKMFETLGISEQVKPKLVLVQGSTRADAAVADGTAEIVLTLSSEILPAPGVMLVGPMPQEVQSYIFFSAGVCSKAASAGPAAALVKFLASPSVAATLKAKGMEAAAKK